MRIKVEIEKAGNGYIIISLNFPSEKRVFTSFTEMMDWLFDWFLEKKELKK